MLTARETIVGWEDLKPRKAKLPSYATARTTTNDATFSDVWKREEGNMEGNRENRPAKKIEKDILQAIASEEARKALVGTTNQVRTRQVLFAGSKPFAHPCQRPPASIEITPEGQIPVHPLGSSTDEEKLLNQWGYMVEKSLDSEAIDILDAALSKIKLSRMETVVQ